MILIGFPKETMRCAKLTCISILHSAVNSFPTLVNIFFASSVIAVFTTRKRKLFPQNGKGLEKAQYWPTYEKDDETRRETLPSMKYACRRPTFYMYEICIKLSLRETHHCEIVAFTTRKRKLFPRNGKGLEKAQY